MPVVKADAYRHGAVEVSRVLVEQGARWLAVSNVEEGVALRQAGISARILVMADFLPVERPALIEYDLTPAIHSLPDLVEWNKLARVTQRPLRYHLKLDTGMGRLGTRAPVEEIAETVLASKRVTCEGLMTHFASSADYDNPQTGQQIGCFRRLAEGLRQAGVKPAYVHLSSTNPVAYGRSETWRGMGTTAMVRPGHAIYGYVSAARGEQAPKRILDVKPALAWRAAILAVKEIPEGARIGYGGIHRTTRRTRIGVLAAGYADGLPHRLSNKGRVIAGGKWAPILGAVSMDLTTVDLTASPELKAGDAVTLIGTEGECPQDAQQMARAAGTISYSVRCGISARGKGVSV
jgi:alanine racemase